MSLLSNSIEVLTPYEFSPTVLAVCCISAWLYVRGQSTGGAQERSRAMLFWPGLLLMYAMLQTQYDFYAQHMFFLHRFQHLILHHLAPFLIALALPQERLLAGIPAPVRQHLIVPLRRSKMVRGIIAAIQQPLIAALLFAGLIYFWLIPDVHFIAMLNLPLYNAMNWGMAVDGLLFWWMVLNMRREGSSAAHHFGGRIMVLFLVMIPQIIIGASITFSDQGLFDVYAVCGRIWPLSERFDQQVGGLITWIPASMMSIAGALILMRRWLRERGREQLIAGGEPCRDTA